MTDSRMLNKLRSVSFAAGLTLALVTGAASQQAIPEYNDQEQPPAPSGSLLWPRRMF